MSDTTCLNSAWFGLGVPFAVIGAVFVIALMIGCLGAWGTRGLRPLTFFTLDGEWHADAHDGRSFRKVGINWYRFPTGEFAKLNEPLDEALAVHRRQAKWLGEGTGPEPEPEPVRNWAD
jgi:hypothetical protein